MRALVLSAALAVSTPALATGSLVCAGNGVELDLLVGHMDVLSIARAVIVIGDQRWSTDPALFPGTRISVGQGFEDENRILVDFTDENVSEVLGRLRVVKGREGDNYAAGGVFTLTGHGAFVVDCSEDR